MIGAAAAANAHRKRSAFDFRKTFANSFHIVKILEPRLLSKRCDDDDDDNDVVVEDANQWQNQ